MSAHLSQILRVASIVLALPIGLAATGLGQQGDEDLQVHLKFQELDFDVQGGDRPQVTVQVERFDTRVAKESGVEVVAVEEATVPGSLTLSLPIGSKYRVSAKSPSFWSPGALVDHDGSRTADLYFSPAGFLEGEISVPKNYNLPGKLGVYLERRYDKLDLGVGSTFDRIELPCSVLESGSWDCQVPAGTFDLKIKSDGFAAEYFWEKEIAAGTSTDLGRLALEPGSSVFGRVETADGEALTADCRVILQRLEAVQPAARNDETLRAAKQTMKPDNQGFFHFKGLSAGGYLLTAEQKGYAPSAELRLIVLKGLEALLRHPIELERPATVKVQILPALDPYGRRWKASLSPKKNRATTQGASGEASSEGLWVVEGVGAGPYRLTVENHRGDRWHTELVNVVPGETLLFASPRALRIRGRFTLGGHPEEAHIWFGGRSHNPNAHHYADEDGNFEGFLPDDGIWKIEAQLPGQGDAVYELEGIEVDSNVDSWFVPVDLNLPATRIAGEVVDEGGLPVSRAKVLARAKGGRSARATVYSDSEGRFEIVGLPEGEISIGADVEEAISDAVKLVLVEDLEEEVVLVLRKRREVRGQVVSTVGPVRNALGLFRPHGGSFGVVSDLQFQSGLDGDFRFTVPDGVEEISLAMMAPGFAARMIRLSVPPEEPLIVPLEMRAGTLLLETTPAQGEKAPGYRMLRKDGAEIPVLYFQQVWRAIHDTQADSPDIIRLPMMEPGVYTLCPSNLNRSRSDGSQECVSGALAPGGELKLSLAGVSVGSTLVERSKSSAGGSGSV